MSTTHIDVTIEHTGEGYAIAFAHDEAHSRDHQS